MWNKFKVNNKVTRTTPLASFCCLYGWLWTYFTPSSTVSIANFEEVNYGCVKVIAATFHFPELSFALYITPKTSEVYIRAIKFLSMTWRKYDNLQSPSKNSVFHLCIPFPNWVWKEMDIHPTTIYLFKVNNKNTRKRCKICSKLASFKVMSLTSFTCLHCKFWIYFTPFSSAFILDLEQVTNCWGSH